MVRNRIRFQGRVQGVGFRMTAAMIARHHDVTGWVRNEPDGSVSLEVQGAPHVVDAYLASVRTAMQGNIHREARNEIGVVEDETGFVIRR